MKKGKSPTVGYLLAFFLGGFWSASFLLSKISKGCDISLDRHIFRRQIAPFDYGIGLDRYVFY